MPRARKDKGLASTDFEKMKFVDATSKDSFRRDGRATGIVPVRLIAKTSTTTVTDKSMGKVVGKP